MMKKMLTMILVTLQLLCVSAYADEVSLKETQKEELYNLGIMVGDENGDLHLDDTITRAEAVKMICVAGHISKDAAVKDVGFKDISNEHWAYSYVCAAKENQLIDGDEEGNFRPEDEITNEEIVKMIVCVLGYRERAESMGGYPAGYTATATRLGITENMDLAVNTPAIRQDVAVMIHRALDVPLMVRVEDEAHPDDAMYSILDGNNGMPLSTLRTCGKE